MAKDNKPTMRLGMLIGASTAIAAGCAADPGYLVRSSSGDYYYLSGSEVAAAVHTGACSAEDCVQMSTSNQVIARKDELEQHRLTDAEPLNGGLDPETHQALDQAIRERQELGTNLAEKLSQYGFATGTAGPTKVG